MSRNFVSTLARSLTWACFLIVSIITAGLSLAPESERDLVGQFQAAVFFSCIPVVAVAEFHIQRFELNRGLASVGLFFALLLLVPTYYAVSVMAAHSETSTGWLLLAGWAFTFVGVISLFAHSRIEWYLVAGFGAFFLSGCILLLVLSLWFWPQFYYGYIKPEGHLQWTPWFMAALGLVVWFALFLLNGRFKKAIQQVAQADLA
ncbi:hypothetical protein [Pseudoalteromonas sp. T1lg88]|uniref:hypothetical protein n=1 Tax=Pseudoalteromonas sp. T1lg88 TaxID=2077104 RepID=UPI000CF5EBB2|nr:hypothetical protein [Pseudoalteromonas sp. T1lg88]